MCDREVLNVSDMIKNGQDPEIFVLNSPSPCNPIETCQPRYLCEKRIHLEKVASWPYKAVPDDNPIQPLRGNSRWDQRSNRIHGRPETLRNICYASFVRRGKEEKDEMRIL